MNVPINNDLRSMGGQMRDAGRPKWEKEFMGTLAGSSRPLKKDHPAASDPKLAVSILKNVGERFPWSVLFLVGRDGNTVRSTLPEPDAVARVNEMGGAIGLAGFLFLRERFTRFVRPFISGMKVERRLREVVDKRWQESQLLISENEETRSQATGTVYTDGADAKIFYSWHAAEKPPKGWELAGVLYVVGEAKDKGWRAKARVTDAKWKAVMEQAMPHFKTEVQSLISLLNAAGLGLQDLKAFIALANKPELLKELEKTQK